MPNVEWGGVIFVPSPTPVLKVFYNQTLISKLKSIFEKEKPAIIHSHFDGYDECCVKANTVGAEIVWHHHNTRALVDNPLKRLYQIAGLRRQYAVTGNAAWIMVIGKDGQKDIERFGYRRKAFLLPNGVLENRISFAEKSPHDIVTFLNFGGRAYQKGLDILLEAVRILVEKGIQFKVQITDGVDTMASLKSFFGESIPEQIAVVPQIEDIQKRFHECDWFISASRHETFSYAIAEAMLSGTPILTSRIEGVSWALEQPSIVAFEPLNACELAEKMEAIIQGEITRSAEDVLRAREYVLENYTASIWADKLIGFYDQILTDTTDDKSNKLHH